MKSSSEYFVTIYGIDIYYFLSTRKYNFFKHSTIYLEVLFFKNQYCSWNNFRVHLFYSQKCIDQSVNVRLSQKSHLLIIFMPNENS